MEKQKTTVMYVNSCCYVVVYVSTFVEAFINSHNFKSTNLIHIYLVFF